MKILMSWFTMAMPRSISRKAVLFFSMLGIVASMFPIDSQALPLFARQTGQNCVACHAGGQFPELTPYGRSFKLTGYTIGDRVAVPLSVMAYGSYTKVSDTSKSDNPAADFAKNTKPVIGGGSVFAGGKITDNIGAFIQWTYDNYAGQGVNGEWHGHSSMDNVDIRYADRFITPNRDLIFGVSLNNNPSVSDVWNTASAWMQYVPGAGVPANQFNDAATPYPGNSAGGNVAGVTAYMYLNKLLYAELGTYRTANGMFSPLSMGLNDASTTKLQGSNNPYWRLALTHEWGAHNIMVGTSGNIAHIYDDPTNPTDSNSVAKITSTGVDAQYQYILDPHTITAQVAYMRQRTNYSANTVAGNIGLGSPFGFFAADGVTPLADPNSSNTTNTFRAKLSYIFQAKYGGSLAYFNLTGTTDTAQQTSGYDPVTGLITSDPTGALGAAALSTRVNGNLSGNPATRGFTYEAFWMPVQYARVGVQYTTYSKYNGASDNYDGLGRNASDNNTLFFYVWGAY